MEKWAVITGGGQGIGAALALNLSGRGLNVLVVDISLEALQKHLTDHSAKGLVHTIEGDVTTEETMDKICSQIPPEDEIKFFIPCQRVGYLKTLLEVKMSEFDNAMRVHVTSPLFLIQRLMTRLDKCHGRILFTITPPEVFPKTGWACYGISKTAFHKLGQQLQFELSGTNVKVALVDPGIVKTEGFQEEVKKMKEGGDSQYTCTLAELQQADEKGFLLEPKVVAQFLSYLLLDVSSGDEFQEGKWSVSDTTLWEEWQK